MAWVVDTSVLLDIHLGDPVFGLPSARCLARHVEDGLILCPVSYIELAPAFGGKNDLQQAFLREAGVVALNHGPGRIRLKPTVSGRSTSQRGALAAR